MDDIIKALLSGASDEKILEMVAEQAEKTGKVDKTSTLLVSSPSHGSTYRSCIKINGKPILPPVMTKESRTECLQWKRKALEVEEKLASKRRAKLSKNIGNILESIKSKPRTNTESQKNKERVITDDSESEESQGWLTVEESEKESVSSDHNPERGKKTFSEMYEILRCNSRAADEVVNGIHIATEMQDVDNKDISIQTGTEEYSASSSKSAPKTFEEIKNLVKSSKITSKSSSLSKRMKDFSDLPIKSKALYSDVNSDISEDSDDDTFAPSITTEVTEDPVYDEYQMSPFRAVISRLKTTPIKEYNITEYLETNNLANQAIGLYDSLVSVNTVIENPSYKTNADESDQSLSVQSSIRPRTGSYTIKKLTQNSNDDNDDGKEHTRQRRGSYSLDKPSPLLLAYHNKLGGKASEEDNKNEKTHISLSSKNVFSHEIGETVRPSTPSGKKEVLERYIASLSEAPTHIRQQNYPHAEEKLCNNISTVGTDKSTKEELPAVNSSPRNITSLVDTKEQVSLHLDLSRSSSPARSIPTPTESSMTIPDSSTYRTSSQSIGKCLDLPVVGPSPLDLQRAVSGLAMQQQESLQELLRMQETERQKLGKEFQMRQQKLVQEIISQFPGLNVNTRGEPDDPELTSARVVRNLEDSFSRQDSSISGVEDKLDTISVSSTISTSYVPTMTKQVIKPETFKKSNQQVKIIQIPAEAFLPKYKNSWNKLTAIARGFLVRRLMATEKVQTLKKTIQETVACAVQLHLESEGPPSREDLDLHGRLLAQLESACHSIHDIFFRLGIPERMAILALNRTAMQRKITRNLEKQDRKISSATEARLKARQNGTQKLETWSDRRKKTVKDAKLITSKPALVGYSRPAFKVNKSPKLKSNKQARSVSSSHSNSRQSPVTMSQLSRSKPTWK